MSFQPGSSSPMRASTREHTPEAKAPLKSKAKPSITPRTFGRFFAPIQRTRTHNRSSEKQSVPSRHGNATTSRNALGDLAPSHINAHLRNPERLFDQDENDEVFREYYHRSKRRRLGQDDEVSSRTAYTTSEESPTTRIASGRALRTSKLVPRSHARGILGENLFRELNWAKDPTCRPVEASFLDTRSETSRYYSRPQDVHVCKDPFGSTRSISFPFCIAACNTNSLVAIGDEEGAVRILETHKDREPSFRKFHLAFRSHQNALLDMTFSSDDALLATASGDQTCQIIDMPRQQPTHTLWGHSASVKQIKFQPGYNSVLATSSRDGCIQLWDLRCAGVKGPTLNVNTIHGSGEEDEPRKSSRASTVTHAACVNVFRRAHRYVDRANDSSNLTLLSKVSRGGRLATALSRDETSVTTISFLSSRSHLLLSGSEADATVKVWDLRSVQSSRRKAAIPISAARQPKAHNLHRRFGLTSMAVGGDETRLYTLCKDNTVYTYSMAHLVLGACPDLDGFARKPRRLASESEGLGPIYGFRHPKLKVSTFYVKLALRRAHGDKPEMLATGSTSSCPVLFPTHERYLRTAKPVPEGDIPIYWYGTPLVHGHEKEVTALAWSPPEGDLITASDDSKCRVWRENAKRARHLRMHGEQGGYRWGHGWAEDGGHWDESE